MFYPCECQTVEIKKHLKWLKKLQAATLNEVKETQWIPQHWLSVPVSQVHLQERKN